jgi:hypothetical protein
MTYIYIYIYILIVNIIDRIFNSTYTLQDIIRQGLKRITDTFTSTEQRINVSTHVIKMRHVL